MLVYMCFYITTIFTFLTSFRVALFCLTEKTELEDVQELKRAWLVNFVMHLGECVVTFVCHTVLA